MARGAGPTGPDPAVVQRRAGLGWTVAPHASPPPFPDRSRDLGRPSGNLARVRSGGAQTPRSLAGPSEPTSPDGSYAGLGTEAQESGGSLRAVLSVEATDEMRGRLVSGLKRYFHGKRLQGLLSIQGLRILDYACDHAAEHVDRPFAIWQSLQKEIKVHIGDVGCGVGGGGRVPRQACASSPDCGRTAPVPTGRSVCAEADTLVRRPPPRAPATHLTTTTHSTCVTLTTANAPGRATSSRAAWRAC